MEKLSDIVKKLSASNTETSYIYQELLSRPEIIEIFNEHASEIDMRKLTSFSGALYEYSNEIKKCQNCLGIASCRQSIRGHFPRLTPINGRLRLEFAPCGYFKSQQHLQNIERFHMPKSMLNASFDTLYEDGNREALFIKCFEFLNNYKQNKTAKGIYIFGSMGHGKTFALCAIANELAKRGVGCAIVYFPELIASIKASFNSETTSSEVIIEKLKTVPVLMLDDIGSEPVTSWMRDEVLGRILNHRMMHELPTFFSSNFTLDELRVHYEQSTKQIYEPVKAARILERIKALSSPFELLGRNYRNEL